MNGEYVSLTQEEWNLESALIFRQRLMAKKIAGDDVPPRALAGSEMLVDRQLTAVNYHLPEFLNELHISKPD